MLPFQKFTYNRLKKKLSLTDLGKKQNLVLSNQDELGPNLLALDEENRKLFYANNYPGDCSYVIVDLNHLEICTVKKEYQSIRAGKLDTKKLHHFLKSIFLNLVFKHGSGSLSLPLFDARNQKQHNAEHFEAKAKKWEIIISKLLPRPAIKTA